MSGATRLSATALTVVVSVLTYLARASTVGARPIPIPDRYTGARPDRAPTIVVTHTGSPWWMFAIVAVAAAALTLAATIAVARLRQPRHLQQA